MEMATSSGGPSSTGGGPGVIITRQPQYSQSGQYQQQQIYQQQQQQQQQQQSNLINFSSCKKIYIQRDYSEGCGVKFINRFPSELEGRIDHQQFEFTINMMNNMYAEAEKANCSTFCEGCMACLTAYVIYFCSETHYEKCLRKVARFIVEQNEQVWVKRGLLITDPIERGLRVIEISILTEPATPHNQS